MAVLQGLSATWALYINNFHAVNSIIFLFCGIGISLLLIKLPTLRFPALPNYRSATDWIKFSMVALLLPISYGVCRKILDGTPVDIQYADMLPVIKVMNQRFVDGNWEAVYKPIPEIWNGVQPVYLPAMWLPFLASLLLDFDMRWITVTGTWLSIIFITWSLPFRKQVLLNILLALSLMSLIAWLHFEISNNVFRLTEEGLIFFYYSAMVCAIVSGRSWLIGLVAAICLLSRYALIGWIPCLGIYWLVNKEYVKLLKALFSGSLVMAALLFIPFGWNAMQVVLDTPAEYIGHTQLEWSRNPQYFYQSLGMAKFFGPTRVAVLHSVLVWGTFLVPLLFTLCSFMYSKMKGRWPHNFLLAAFQLAITFFYNFLDVTYLYLFYTPVFISLLIAALSMPRPSLMNRDTVMEL